MKIILLIDLPGVKDQGDVLARQFVDVLVNCDANAEAIIHTVTSVIPHKKETTS